MWNKQYKLSYQVYIVPLVNTLPEGNKFIINMSFDYKRMKIVYFVNKKHMIKWKINENIFIHYSFLSKISC